MNNKVMTFIKNFSYTLSSNLVSMVISTVVILIVPKLIGVKEYGYWQLYLFYSSYVGFLHFGWNDGVYLRYGGKRYKELNKRLFFSQFWTLVISQILLGTIIISLSSIFHMDINRLYILKSTVLCMLFVNVRLMLIYILQCTNRIKDYAKITIMEKVLYSCLILIFLLVGIRQYKFFIIADLIGKSISLLYATYCCGDIVFKKISKFYFNFKETVANINVGLKLMVANIASMLIIGIVRFGIERAWDVATFGKVSLTLSISYLILVFIDAIGVIMFPALRRMNKQQLPTVYTTMRSFLMIALLGVLVAYYPIKGFLSIWLPQYNESLSYMALLFPMCVYEGKMALLINTYLKTLRKEKLMLSVNLVSVLLSLLLTILTTVIYKNVTFAIMSIVILLAFRSALAEVLLSKILHVAIYKCILVESLLSLTFIVLGWFISSLVGGIIYLAVYTLYLILEKEDILSNVKRIKRFARV